MNDAKIEVKIDTPGGVEARQKVKTWTDSVVKVGTRTVAEKLGPLKAKELINTPDDLLA